MLTNETIWRWNYLFNLNRKNYPWKMRGNAIPLSLGRSRVKSLAFLERRKTNCLKILLWRHDLWKNNFSLLPTCFYRLCIKRGNRWWIHAFYISPLHPWISFRNNQANLIWFPVCAGVSCFSCYLYFLYFSR